MRELAGLRQEQEGQAKLGGCNTLGVTACFNASKHGMSINSFVVA
jgi:hypothetical protein